MEDLTIIQTDTAAIPDKAMCDMQVATAHQYPRVIKKAVDNMLFIATKDKKTAESCGYSLPRAGKQITGGSIHLARIIANNWGNLRVESHVTRITATAIFSEATAWDLETNVAVKVETSRKIVSKTGARFSEDIITLTGQVINSIAFRNAIFSIVPKFVIDDIYEASIKAITGDLSDEQKLIKKRKQIIDAFSDTYGVSEKELLLAIGLNTVNQIKAEQIKMLIGMANTIKEGEFTVDEMFNRLPDDKKKEALTKPEAVK